MAARRTPGLLWCAALLAVPTVLAGVGSVWPGPPAPTAAVVAAPGGVGVAGGSDVATAAAPATDAPALAGQEGGGPDAAAPTAPLPTAPLPTAQPPTAQVPTAGTLPVAEEVAALVTAAPVRFGADSAVLEGAAAGTVRSVAALLAPAGAAVVLTGHVADTPGSPEGAQALSERRAVAVADALVAGGVDRARITTVGRGSSEPLESRAASRRVEFEIR